MLATLFAVILISFIGVGLPDSILGVAWPTMYQEFGLPISLAGYISATVSIGTIISSLMSSRLIGKFGTGAVTAASTLLTAIALFGFAFTNDPLFFFIFAIPMGIGAGAVDTGLNAFVATNYSAASMSFLHCSYGLGVMASPFIMSLALGESGDWRRGYLIVALIQAAITIITFISLPLWKKADKRSASGGAYEQEVIPIKEVVKIPGVILSALAFLTICALELTTGAWCSSYFVNSRGISADGAALVTMVFYIGFILGRFLSGLLVLKLGSRMILMLSAILLMLSLPIFALPLPTQISASSLFFLGMGIGPIYPNLMHLTPIFFGLERSQSIIGFQQSATYIGIMVMPWLFGILADIFSTALLPFYLLIFLLFYVLTLGRLLKTVKKAK